MYRIWICLCLLFYLIPCALQGQNVPPVSASDSVNTKAPQTGYVQIGVNTDSLYLYIDKEYNRPLHLASGDSLELGTGFHDFVIFGKIFAIDEHRIMVYQDSTVTRNYSYMIPENPGNHDRRIYARMQWQANLMVFSDEESTIFVNNKPIDMGSATLTLGTGVHKIEARHPSERTKSELVKVNAYALTQVDLYTQPSKATTIASALVPGAAQFYKDQYLKGGVSLVLTGLATGFFAHNYANFKTSRNEFNRLNQTYQATSDETLALQYGDELERKAHTVNQFENRKNLFLALAGVLYALNIYDALRPPEYGFRNTRSFDPFTDFDVHFSNPTPSISLTLDF